MIDGRKRTVVLVVIATANGKSYQEIIADDKIMIYPEKKELLSSFFAAGGGLWVQKRL